MTIRERFEKATIEDLEQILGILANNFHANKELQEFFKKIGDVESYRQLDTVFNIESDLYLDVLAAREGKKKRGEN